MSKLPFGLLVPHDKDNGSPEKKIDVKPVDAAAVIPELAPIFGLLKPEIAKSNLPLFGSGSPLIPVAPIDSNLGFGRGFGFTDAAAMAKQTKETAK